MASAASADAFQCWFNLDELSRLSESSKKSRERKREPLRRNDDQVEPISFILLPPFNVVTTVNDYGATRSFIKINTGCFESEWFLTLPVHWLKMLWERSLCLTGDMYISLSTNQNAFPNFSLDCSSFVHLLFEIAANYISCTILLQQSL